MINWDLKWYEFVEAVVYNQAYVEAEPYDCKFGIPFVGSHIQGEIYHVIN